MSMYKPRPVQEALHRGDKRTLSLLGKAGARKRREKSLQKMREAEEEARRNSERELHARSFLEKAIQANEHIIPLSTYDGYD